MISRSLLLYLFSLHAKRLEHFREKGKNLHRTTYEFRHFNRAVIGAEFSATNF